MSNKGREAIFSLEVQEVQLSEVDDQDMITLETSTGSTYTLTVVSTQGYKPVVILNRQSERQIDLDESLKFCLIGSCEGSLESLDEDELTAVGASHELIAVDRQVMLQAEEAPGSCLMTSPVTSIQWTKAGREEVPA